MEKLTLEQISTFYPHDLKVMTPDGIATVTSIIGADPFYEVKQQDTVLDDVLLRVMDELGNFATWGISQIKLLLYPSSQLTKPMEDGSVPMGVIWEIVTGGIYNEEYVGIKDEKWRITVSNSVDSLKFYKEEPVFIYESLTPDGEGTWNPPYNQLALFQYMASKKIDFIGLIERGLAIDATTLNVNPYL